MTQKDKTKEEFIEEIKLLQKRIAELEKTDTERKETNEELNASEERYRSLFISSRDAAMILEPPDWKFTAANPATLEMFKAKNEKEFLSYGPWGLSPKLQPDGRDSIEKAKEMIETTMREGSHFFNWVHKRINGEEFFADVLLSRVEYGGKVLVHAVVRDITERKEIENGLEKARKELAVARELKQNPALKDVPIVAVTSYVMVGDRERALEAGCNGYIEKPINPDTFRSQIEKYLKAQPAGEGSES